MLLKTLTHPNSLHITAAQGWLELGDHLSANEELEKVDAELRGHPAVLEVRWAIYSKEKKWDACIDIAAAIIALDPKNFQAWIHRSFALHEMKRTQEAYDSLLPAIRQFTKIWVIPYNLACYSAQLGRIPEAEEWFKQAMAIDADEARLTGIDDPDLKPLWDSIGIP